MVSMRDCLTGRDRWREPKGRPARGAVRVQGRWITVLSKRLAVQRAPCRVRTADARHRPAEGIAPCRPASDVCRRFTMVPVHGESRAAVFVGRRLWY
jgi:hypothetical protein